jgi:hypothetical protein
MIESEMQAETYENWHREFRERVAEELLHQRVERYGSGDIPRDEDRGQGGESSNRLRPDRGSRKDRCKSLNLI